MGYSEGVAVCNWIELELVAAVFLSVEVDETDNEKLY